MTNEEIIMRYSFWDVVSECLVKFHSLNPAGASEQSAKLRGRLWELDRPAVKVYPSDMVYHEEPFYIACSLMKRPLKLEDSDYRERYQAILQGHGW